jgi:hypothetical protein
VWSSWRKLRAVFSQIGIFYLSIWDLYRFENDFGPDHVCFVLFCFTWISENRLPHLTWQNLIFFLLIQFLSTHLKGKDHSEDVGIDGRIILEWILGKWHGKVGTGCMWLRTGTSGRLLWTRSWTFVSHKRQGISWLSEWLWASQEGLCPSLSC